MVACCNRLVPASAANRHPSTFPWWWRGQVCSLCVHCVFIVCSLFFFVDFHDDDADRCVHCVFIVCSLFFVLLRFLQDFNVATAGYRLLPRIHILQDFHGWWSEQVCSLLFWGVLRFLHDFTVDPAVTFFICNYLFFVENSSRFHSSRSGQAVSKWLFNCFHIEETKKKFTLRRRKKKRLVSKCPMSCFDIEETGRVRKAIVSEKVLD